MLLMYKRNKERYIYITKKDIYLIKLIIKGFFIIKINFDILFKGTTLL